MESTHLLNLSHVQLFAAPWTVAHQATLSMEFTRQEYWSGCPFPSPGNLPNAGVEPRSPALQVDSLRLSHQGRPSTSDTPGAIPCPDIRTISFRIITAMSTFSHLWLSYTNKPKLTAWNPLVVQW